MATIAARRHSPTIGIVGGGPGGLTLARILHVNGVFSTVFERDEHPLARPQGGSLDIHPDSGQVAISSCKLESEFRAVSRPEDQGNKLFDAGGSLLFEEAHPEAKNRPEIDRSSLREILLRSLPEGVVRWGSKVTDVQPHSHGGFEILLGTGETAHFDLVFGADGAWSRVRSLLTPTQPEYSGVTFIDMNIHDVDKQHPELAVLVGRGKIMAADGQRFIIAQRNAAGHVRVYAGLKVPQDWVRSGGLDTSSPASMRRSVVAQYEVWTPSLVALIEATSDLIVPWPIYELPAGFQWANRPGLTILGDAAHLMAPFGGNGVNLAMLDATELARALMQGTDWISNVASFEQDMCRRAAAAAQAAARALRKVTSPGAVSHSLQHLERTYGANASDSSSPRELPPVS